MMSQEAAPQSSRSDYDEMPFADLKTLSSDGNEEARQALYLRHQNLFMARGHGETGFSELEEMVRNGDLDAKYSYATLSMTNVFAEHEDKKSDAERALQSLKELAAAGHRDAMFFLAYWGNYKDIPETIQLLEGASAQNHPVAKVVLGYKKLFEESASEKSEGYKLIEDAVNLMDVSFARKHLADCFADGLFGTEKNINAAVSLHALSTYRFFPPVVLENLPRMFSELARGEQGNEFIANNIKDYMTEKSPQYYQTLLSKDEVSALDKTSRIDVCRLFRHAVNDYPEGHEEISANLINHLSQQIPLEISKLYQPDSF